MFDVGGVLLDWDPRNLYRKLIPDPAEMEWFLANVCTSKWHEPHDRGASTVRVLRRVGPSLAGLCRTDLGVVGTRRGDGRRPHRQRGDSAPPRP